MTRESFDGTALLSQAASEPDRVRRHLFVAAAIREVFPTEPIVVGGLAEDFYTGDDYKPTDLDMCARVGVEQRKALEALGLERDGRHWYHEDGHVAVEFPEELIDGDESRTLLVQVGSGAARIIGLDDLYLDRLRRATASESVTDIAFKGAVVIATVRFEDLDWKYIRDRILAEPLGPNMRTLNRKVRVAAGKAIRRALRSE